MTVFVDTSALYAALDAGDRHHDEAREAFGQVFAAKEDLVTHDFVVVETSALVQRRLPPLALADLHRRLLGVIRVDQVPAGMRDRAIAAVIAAPRGPSRVDRVSFEFIFERGIRSALAFDGHFEAMGIVRPRPSA